MKITVGKLRKLIYESLLVEKKKDRKRLPQDINTDNFETIKISEYDIVASLEPSNKRYLGNVVGGRGVFCPFVINASFNLNKLDSSPNYENLTSLKIYPFEVISAAKRGRFPLEIPSLQRQILLVADAAIRRFMAEYMAEGIYRGLQKQQFDAVLDVESSSVLTKEMASFVASKFGVEKIPMGHISRQLGGLYKTTDPMSINIDDKAFDEYAERNPDDADNFLTLLTQTVNDLRDRVANNETISIARDLKGTIRHYITGLHGIGDAANDVKNVLVIDDNIETAATLGDIGRMLRKRNINCDFAAGVTIASKYR